jgi:hypothetical protein
LEAFTSMLVGNFSSSGLKLAGGESYDFRLNAQTISPSFAAHTEHFVA